MRAAAPERSEPGPSAGTSFLSQLKGLSRDAVLYGTGDAFGRLISIVTAPILTRILVPSDYGALNLVQTWIGFFVMLAGMNLNSGTYFYFFKHDDPRDRTKILSTALLFFVVAGLLLSSLIWLLAPRIELLLLLRASGAEAQPDYPFATYLRILACGVSFSLLDSNFRSYLRMTRQPWKFVAISLTQVSLTVTLILTAVLYFEWRIVGILWASVIANVATAFLGLALVIRHYRLAFSGAFFSMMAAYALPQLPAVVINWCTFQSNRLFLNYYSSLEHLGWYAIAAQVAGVLLILTTAFRMAYDPLALSIMKRSDAARSYARFYTLFVVGFGCVAAGAALAAQPVFQILTPPNYHDAYTIVGILVFGYLYLGANNILGTGIWLSERTSFTSYAQAIAFAVNMALNFLLIPLLAVWGAALALAGGVLAQSFSYYAFAQRLHPIPYRYWRLHGFVLGLVAIVGLHVYAVRDSGPLVATASILLTGPAILALAWTAGLTSMERGQVRQLTRSALRRSRSGA